MFVILANTYISNLYEIPISSHNRYQRVRFLKINTVPLTNDDQLRNRLEKQPHTITKQKQTKTSDYVRATS